MVFMLKEEQTVDTILFRIQQWDGWIAIQKGVAKEYSMPEREFYLILPEYQKFMGLLALGYRGIGMWSQKVDVIWHAHILNTQRYENFCRTIIGEMVHHVPCCDMQRIEPGLSCGEPEPEPSCAEPDPGPSYREPDPGPSCKGEDLSSRPIGDRQRASTAIIFSKLYMQVYCQVPPPEIWDFTGADGRAV